eukprot:393327_1
MDNGFDDTEESHISFVYASYGISKLRMTVRSLWLGFKFYFRFSKKEIKRHLFNFIIGILSCTITVFVAATISTIVDDAPFVILKQAENTCGQYDIQITPRNGPYLNYSLVKETLSKYANYDIAKLSTSRYVFNDTQALFFTPQCYNNINNTNDLSNYMDLYDENDCKPKFMKSSNSLCKQHLSLLWIIDFEKERAMGFGAHFPQHLIPQRGEIVINKKQMEAFDINIGDYLFLFVDLDNGNQQHLLYSIIKSDDKYGETAEGVADSEYCSRILFPVRVIGIVDQISYGKFGSKINKYTFIMNNKYFTEYISLYSNDKLSNSF